MFLEVGLGKLMPIVKVTLLEPEPVQPEFSSRTYASDTTCRLFFCK